QGWCFIAGSGGTEMPPSQPPTYATHAGPKPNTKLQLRFTGSFRLAAGMLHLHNNYSFTESLVETVVRSLRHSCRSELTRQGTSLSSVTPDGQPSGGRAFLPASACRHAARTVPSSASRMPGVQSLRIPGSTGNVSLFDSSAARSA